MAEKGGQREGDQWDGEAGQGSPEEEGVPLPLPELAGERERMFPDGVNERGCGEPKARSVEDAGSDVEKGNEEEQLERIDDVAAELGGGDVHPEEEGGGEA